MKQIALCYAMKLSSRWMMEQFKLLQSDDDMAPGRITNTEALGQIASTSAGLKAFTTFLALEGIEDCRKCCGGNGYLLNSGVAALGADYAWQVTAEGDWVILLLQLGRFLLKTLKQARNGEDIPGPCAYLANAVGPRWAKATPPPVRSKDDLRNMDVLRGLFEHRAAAAVVAASDCVEEHMAKVCVCIYIYLLCVVLLFDQPRKALTLVDCLCLICLGCFL